MASIQKRKGKNGVSYRIRITIGTDAKGDPIQKTKTWKPPSGMTAKQAERQALREADKFEELIRKGINTDKLTFRELTDIYIEEISKTQKPRAVESHKGRLGRINDFLGHMEIKNVNAQHIRQFRKELEKPIKKPDGTEKTLAAATVHGYLRTVSCILSFACEQDYVTENVCLGKKVKKPKLDEGKDKMIQPEVLNAYVKLMEDAPIRNRAFFKIALGTGMRRGEILALKWDDIDFENKTLDINESVNWISGRGFVYGKPKL